MKDKKTENNQQIEEENEEEAEEEQLYYSDDHSELIVKGLLNKFISIAIRKSEANLDETEKKFCFSEMKKELIHTLKMERMAYDVDDTSPDIQRDLFYSEIIPPSNSWKEIIEPICPGGDRCCSDQILNGNEEDLRQITDKEEQEFIQTKNSLKTIASVRLNKTDNSKTGTSMLLSTSIMKKELSKALGNKLMGTINERKKKTEGVELPAEDIIGEEFGYKEEIDCNPLREEMILEIKKKEEERRKKRMEAEASGVFVTSAGEKIEIKKLKPIVLKNQTFNVDGTIIPKKSINSEKNNTEYNMLRTGIKAIFEGRKKDIKKTRRNYSDKKEIRKEDSIIRNKDPNLVTFEVKDVNLINAEKIQPSGHNYDLILPEIGVKVSTNKASKGGNKDFSKYFNKTSMQDYDKMLTEAIPNLNKTMLQEKVGTVKHSLLNKSVNSMNSPTGRNISTPKKSFNNPLLVSSNQDTSGNLESVNEAVENSFGAMPSWNNISSSQVLNSMNMSGKYISLGSINQSRINNSLDGSIKMNERFLNSSVKLHLDTLEDELNIDPMLLSQGNKSTVFNSNLRKRKLNQIVGLKTEGTDLKSINKFTKELVQGQYSKESKKSNNVETTHFKPTKWTIKKELGIKIMNTKLPRSRTYTHDGGIETDVEFFKM
ncbi:MAG: hypothetical protein MJ252_23310 [archaeon]|nr:hypothetical protein [archaeon]